MVVIPQSAWILEIGISVNFEIFYLFSCDWIPKGDIGRIVAVLILIDRVKGTVITCILQRKSSSPHRTRAAIIGPGERVSVKSWPNFSPVKMGNNWPIIRRYSGVFERTVHGYSCGIDEGLSPVDLGHKITEMSVAVGVVVRVHAASLSRGDIPWIEVVDPYYVHCFSRGDVEHWSGSAARHEGSIATSVKISNQPAVEKLNGGCDYSHGVCCLGGRGVDLY